MKNKKRKNRGFTLVEVLICVGIIGIIAAITIPALLTSTSEKALEAQRKALHSRMAQAFGQIRNLKIYERTEDEVDPDTGDTTKVDGDSALNFISEGLSLVYKLSNVCNAASIKECGIHDTILDYYSDTNVDSFPIGSKLTFTDLNEKISQDDLGDTKKSYAAFKTANGESVLLYYNPKCKSKKESAHNIMYSVCVNMIYDLNGRKAPNAYGEDIGIITVFYPNDSSVVMPVLYNKEVFTAATYSEMLAKAAELNLVPPTEEELTALLVNKNLAHISKVASTSQAYWSSSYNSSNAEQVWTASIDNGLKLENVSGGTPASLQYFLLKK